MVITILLYEQMQKNYEIKANSPLEGVGQRPSAPPSNTKKYISLKFQPLRIFSSKMSLFTVLLGWQQSHFAFFR